MDGNTGNLDAIVSGGSGSYNYTWTGANFFDAFTSSTSFTTDDLNVSITLVVEDIITGCIGTATIDFSVQEESCWADFDGNGLINVNDLIGGGFMSQYGATGADVAGDYDCNGVVNIPDLLAFIAAFGSFCE